MGKNNKLLCQSVRIRFVLCFFIYLLYPTISHSKTEYLYVGQTYHLETPDAVSSNGYIDHAALISSSKHLYVDVSDPSDVKIIVLDYFSNSVTVEVLFVEKYTDKGHIQKLNHNVSVDIVAKYPKVEIPLGYDEITIKTGETGKLQYKVTPSGLMEPPMNFGISPFNVPEVSFENSYYDQDTGYGYMEVKAKKTPAINLIFALPYGDQNIPLIWTVNIVKNDKEKIKLEASQSEGEVSKGTIIYLKSTNVPDAEIYYTLDGSNPTKYSNKYTSLGITINEDCTLKAIAYKDGYDDSNVFTQKYTIEKEKIKIDATNFPDVNFRNFLLEQNYGKDSAISEDEILEITSMYVDYKGIVNLKGIEYFTALTSLDCSGNKLNTLDISKNTALQYLDCSSCELTELNVSRNTAMTRLDCSWNKLTSLDMSGNIALISLDCYENLIKGKAMDDLINSLPYNYSTDKFIIHIRLNPSVDDGNVCTMRQAAALKAKGWVPYCSYYDPENPYGMSWREYEGFDDTAITIDATNFPDNYFRQYLLEQNYGKDRIITEEELKVIDFIDVSGSKDSSGNITSLQGIEYFTELKWLCCYYNKLTSLDVSKNTALTNLYCDDNLLTSLDVSKNLSLTGLICSSNQLTSLDVSKNTALTNLYCDDNLLTSLDVSKNIALNFIDCGHNQLTSLDVSRNTSLTDLICYSNKLTSLDVSNNMSLKKIECYYNQIKGVEMDMLINSLPQRNTNDGVFRVVLNPDTDGNVCTADQVAAVKAKGWIPYYYNNGWQEYEGKNPTPEPDNQKISIIFEVNNKTDGDVNWLKMMVLLNTELCLVIWASQDHITSETIKPGATYKFKIITDRSILGSSFADNDKLKRYYYNSNFLIYDENNSIMTYVTEKLDPSKTIVDGGVYSVNIVRKRNTNSIISPQYIEDASNVPIYNLNGQRMDNPRKGINIIGGKKILIK